MANFSHRKTSCCNANCTGNSIPDAWKIDTGGWEFAGPFGDVAWWGVHKLEWVEGPMPTFPHYCHWQKIVGPHAEIHLYKEFGDPAQSGVQFRLVYENFIYQMNYFAGFVGPVNCLNKTVDFVGTVPPDEPWNPVSSIVLLPWTFADDP